MDLTSTGATITLEARDTLNCEQVCFEYQRSEPFNCQRANKFSLNKFSNVEGLDLPLCVCIRPWPTRLDVPVCADCESATPTNIVRPQYIQVTIATSSQCCVAQQYCEEFNGSWVFELETDCGNTYGRQCIDIVGANCDGSNPSGCLRYLITATYSPTGAGVQVTQCGFTCADPDCPPSGSTGSGWDGDIGLCSTSVHNFIHTASETTPWDEVCSKTFQWTEDEWLYAGAFGTDCTGPEYLRCGSTTITVTALGNTDLPEPTDSGNCSACGA